MKPGKELAGDVRNMEREAGEAIIGRQTAVSDSKAREVQRRSLRFEEACPLSLPILLLAPSKLPSFETALNFVWHVTIVVRLICTIHGPSAMTDGV
jgi:hypothetical protein